MGLTSPDPAVEGNGLTGLATARHWTRRCPQGRRLDGVVHSRARGGRAVGAVGQNRTHERISDGRRSSRRGQGRPCRVRSGCSGGIPGNSSGPVGSAGSVGPVGPVASAGPVGSAEVVGPAASVDMSMTDWVEVIAQSQAMINQLTAVQAVAVARVAATESVEAEDGTVDERSCLLGHVRLDAAALVAEPLGVTESAAQRRVSLAVREVTVLRSVHESMAAGTIDGWRAALVGEELLDAPDDVARATASRVVDGLARRSGAEVRRRVRRALAAIDEEWLRQRTERARRDRSVRRWAQEPGVDAWFGTFPAEQSAVAWAAVDDLAQRYRRDGSCESIEQARADAMLDLVLGRATTRVTVQLTVPAEPGSAPGPTGDDQRNAAAGPPTGRAVPGAACPFFATAGAGALGGDAVGAQVGCGGAERGGAERGGAERGGSVGGEPAAVSAPGGATATAVESGRAVADDDSAATRALVGHVLQSLPPAGAFVEVRGLDGSGSSEVPAAWVAAHLEQAAAAHSPVGREAVEVFACHPSTGALIDATARPDVGGVPPRRRARPTRACPGRSLSIPWVLDGRSVLRPRPRPAVADGRHLRGQPRAALSSTPSRQAVARLVGAPARGRHDGLVHP